jgi:hypothetical protein
MDYLRGESIPGRRRTIQRAEKDDRLDHGSREMKLPNG